MNQRLAAMAALSREVAMPMVVLACLAASGFARVDPADTVPTVARLAPSLTADAKVADQRSASVAPVAAASSAIEAVVAAETTTAMPLATHESDPVVAAALTDSSPPPQANPPATPEAKVSVAALEPGDNHPAAASTETQAPCSVAETCVDSYLWTLYQRTPKEDSVRTEQRRDVTIKKKGKLVTVAKTFARIADEDFAWKDLKAAERVGMPMVDYVIGGMDREFKLRLVQMLRAAENAGLSPGITSAFRDDYRQSIANGLKAADNRSYHGGSLRGGYGHGLAADIVSVNGATRADRLASSQVLWKWVDVHGKDFGIGRPYLGRDPPHVAPIDGQEFATHRPGAKVRQAGSATKPSTPLVSGADHSAAKHARAARSPKVRTI